MVKMSKILVVNSLRRLLLLSRCVLLVTMHLFGRKSLIRMECERDKVKRSS